MYKCIPGLSAGSFKSSADLAFKAAGGGMTFSESGVTLSIDGTLRPPGGVSIRTLVLVK